MVGKTILDGSYIQTRVHLYLGWSSILVVLGGSSTPDLKAILDVIFTYGSRRE
jgi:hypothetical protein